MDTAQTTTQQPEVHSKENCWKVKSGEYVPFNQLSNSQLRSVKHFAQTREEYFFKKLNEFGEIVAKLDEEAEKRKIKLKDRNCKFQKNQRVLKDAIKHEKDASPCKENMGI